MHPIPENLRRTDGRAFCVQVWIWKIGIVFPVSFSVPSADVESGDRYTKNKSSTPRCKIVRIHFGTMTPPDSPFIHLCWTVVNVLVVLFSTILFIDILRAQDDRSERPGALAEYLVYNFGTSLVWVVEVSLKAYYENWNLNKLLLLEWILAIYFVGDSLNLVFQWKIKAKTDLSENEVEALVGILSYSYMSYKTYNAYRKSTTRLEYQQLSEEPALTADV